MAQSDEQAEAGWYPNPDDSGQLRYWDGSGWSEKVKAQPLQAGSAPERPRGPVNRLAVAAFICAFFVPTSIPAIVLGFLALDELEDAAGTQRGQGLAMWAIGLGFITLLLGAVGIAYLISTE